MRVASIALTALLVACSGARDAPIPMPTIVDEAHCAGHVDTMVVLLPGAHDHAGDFAKEGFVHALRERHVAADVVLADATMNYYRDGVFVERLDADVLAPAAGRGIRHVWLAGVSLGGLGSLVATNERRMRVDGLLLIAPYLGERTIVAEIAASGGVARWSPPGVVPREDADRRLWQWIKELTVVHGNDATYPSTWLGFGVDDRFVAAHRLLAATLPSDHVFTAPGGHDWPAWRAVWGAMLDAVPLPRDASCVARPR
jgi:pimeloyl-ACP methyl ester carboxylesterase